MYKILLKQRLTPNIHLFKVEAPAVAKKAQPGQFVVIRVDERGERIPVTIADWDNEEGDVATVQKSTSLHQGKYADGQRVNPSPPDAHQNQGHPHRQI
ncbi:hypothetical protein ES703_81421 [subsurface metagenome]